MRKMDMRRMMARQMMMKIHFELKTISRGINKISKWNIIVSKPVNKLSSYLVYKRCQIMGRG
jgi:hypothetical protein